MSRYDKFFMHILLFAVAMLSIGSASILVRFSKAGGVACAFWRLSISSILILPIVLRSAHHIKNSNTLFVTGYELSLMGLAGVSLAFHFILWMESLFRIPIAVSVTIVVAYPLYLAVLELFKDRGGEAIISAIGIAVGFLGILIFFGGSLTTGGIDLLGVTQSFVASIVAAVYFYIGRIVRRSRDVYSYTFTVYSIASITALLYSIAVGENIFAYLPRSWYWFLLLALIPMIGGHTVMNYLVKFYRSSSVTSIALAEPIIATILAYITLGETPKFSYIPPLIMVLIGIGIALYGEARRALQAHGI